METPTQEATTPTNTADDESSRVGSLSPSWSPSPQRRAPATRARGAKSPREKKARPRRTPGGRGNTGGVAINAPMSQSTLHLTHIPIKDMYAWAHRSEEERREQAEKKQSIPRPMNAFMMYRLAYSNRAKEFLNVKNYQIVNTAIAHSWALETDEVRNFYNEMSKIERDNHQRTHPTFKFRPNRGPAFASRTGPITPPPSADTFENDSVAWSDGEYGSPRAFHHHHHDRSQSLDAVSDFHSRDSTPFDHPSVEHTTSYASWNNFPSATMPTIQPSALHGTLGSHVEDVHYHRSSPAPTNVQYDLSNGLAGLPGNTHHELLQTQASHISEGNLDPQMLTYPEGQHMNMQPAFAPVANPYPVWGEEDPANNCYLTSSSHPASATASPGPSTYHHHQLASYAMQRNPSWEASQHDIKDVTEQWINM